MRRLLFVVVVMALVVPAYALPVWYDNFESFNGGVAGAGSLTTEAVPAGWIAWAQRGIVGGTSYGTSSGVISHLTQEIDNANPANFLQGTGNKLGTDTSIEGANNYQLTLGMKPAGGSAPYGGVWRIITGLPIGVTLTLDGGVRCRGGTGTTASLEIDVSDATSTLPVNGSDFTAGSMVRKSVRTSASANGMGQWSDGTWGNLSTNHLGNGQFTTTDGTVLVMMKIWSGSTLNNTTVYDLDDIQITPEPASLILLALGLPMLRRRHA